MAEHIARFEILQQIGEGGMGAVFKARDPGINRIVAIKLLREGFDSSVMRERFMQEARSAGSLQNPNIVTIFELGEHNGAPFIVMEFVVGEAMNDLIRRRAPMRITRKLELMEALCSGLGYAHRSGIIHRDIKPANLMINLDGILKILDFGIAKVLDYGIGRGGAGLTKTGAFIGTPNYMAPEQLCGEPMDHRADIFAVGAVFYELLSCQRAFPGASIEAIAQVLHREPDRLSTLCDGLDPQIETVVVRALEKNPDKRYQDLSDMRRDIARIRRELSRDTPDTLSELAFEKTLIIKGGAVSAGTQAETAEAETVARAAAAIEDAERQFEQGHTRDALDRLERFAPPHPLVADALVRLRERSEELDREAQRAATVERMVDASSEAFQRGDYEAAIRFADEALIVNERSAAARDVRRRARSALDEQRRRAETERRIEAAIADARRVFAAGDRQAALDALAAFEPAEPAIGDALDELRADAAAIEKREREEAERRRREGEERSRLEAEQRRRDEERRRVEQARREANRLTAIGRQLLSSGRPEEAAAVAADALRLVDDHAPALTVAAEAGAAIELARQEAARLEAARLEQVRQADLRRQEEARRAELRRQQEEAAAAERQRALERQRAEERARAEAAAKVEADRRRALEERRGREAAEAKAAEEQAAAREAARTDVAAREAAAGKTKEAPAVRRGPARWIAAAGVGIVVLGLAAYEVNRLRSPIPEDRGPKPVVTAPPPTGPTANSGAVAATGPAATADSGTATGQPTVAPPVGVKIDASPWADLTLAPVQPSANSRDLKGTTPFAADLPPGEYTVTLSNPLAPRGRLTQRITVAAGKDNVFRFTIPGLDPDKIVNEVLAK